MLSVRFAGVKAYTRNLKLLSSRRTPGPMLSMRFRTVANFFRSPNPSSPRRRGSMERLICGCAALQPRVGILSMDPGVRRDDGFGERGKRVTSQGCLLSMGLGVRRDDVLILVVKKVTQQRCALSMGPRLCGDDGFGGRGKRVTS
jgi:hypothetical protein